MAYATIISGIISAIATKHCFPTLDQQPTWSERRGKEEQEKRSFLQFISHQQFPEWYLYGRLHNLKAGQFGTMSQKGLAPPPPIGYLRLFWISDLFEKYWSISDFFEFRTYLKNADPLGSKFFNKNKWAYVLIKGEL